MANKVLYDVEVYRNCFLCSVKDVDSKKTVIWEISDRKNDLNAIKQFFNTYNQYLISFNGIHYDNCIIMYVLLNNFKTTSELLNGIKNFSDIIINNDGAQDWWRDKRYSKYKYHNRWIDIDLFLYWSKMLRISKKISLKGLAIQLNYPVVQELPFDPAMLLNHEQIDELIHYNSVHDLGILELLFEKQIYMQGKKTTMREQASIRHDAFLKYGFKKDVYSWDGVKLGLNVLIRSYCEATNQDEGYIKSLRGKFEPISLKDIISDKVYFEETKLDIRYKEKKVLPNSFHSLLTYLKQLTVNGTDEIDCTVLYRNNLYDFMSGGLHTRHKDQIVEPDLTKFIYEDVDVGSYYPTLGAKYKFTPSHLPGMDTFLDSYRLERLKDKKEGRKAEERLKKLALNGGYYGNLNNEYTPMYDPKQMLSITINGQLFLLMLVEWCAKEGIEVDMANTDGVTFIIPVEKEEIFKVICKRWEELTYMDLESVRYKKVVRKNINNYLAISIDGSSKEKGLFVTEPDLGNSVDFLIIPKALGAYYLKGTPVDEFVRNHRNIFDFCCSQKVDKSYHIMWTDSNFVTSKQQRLNRFYASTKGGYIYKCRNGKQGHLLKESGVQIYNDHKEVFPTDINYRFYISKINEIINELKNNNQLDMFE